MQVRIDAKTLPPGGLTGGSPAGPGGRNGRRRCADCARGYSGGGRTCQAVRRAPRSERPGNVSRRVSVALAPGVGGCATLPLSQTAGTAPSSAQPLRPTSSCAFQLWACATLPLVHPPLCHFTTLDLYLCILQWLSRLSPVPWASPPCPAMRPEPISLPNRQPLRALGCVPRASRPCSPVVARRALLAVCPSPPFRP
jgi:hypothetical protein